MEINEILKIIKNKIEPQVILWEIETIDDDGGRMDEMIEPIDKDIWLLSIDDDRLEEFEMEVETIINYLSPDDDSPYSRKKYKKLLTDLNTKNIFPTVEIVERRRYTRYEGEEPQEDPNGPNWLRLTPNIPPFYSAELVGDILFLIAFPVLPYFEGLSQKTEGSWEEYCQRISLLTKVKLAYYNLIKVQPYSTPAEFLDSILVLGFKDVKERYEALIKMGWESLRE